MSSAQPPLEIAAAAIESCVPAGWHVRAQYLIATDAVVFRIVHADRVRFVDLPTGSPAELYQSIQGLVESRKADIDAAIVQMMDLCPDLPQVQANG